LYVNISRNGQGFGPYTLEQVKAYLASGQLYAADLAWYQGLDRWVPLGELPVLHPTDAPNQSQSFNVKPLLIVTAIVLVGMVIAAVLVSTLPTSPRSASTSGFINDPHIEYVNGSKITVHFNAEQNKTFYNQSDIKFTPPTMEGVKKGEGDHAFEIVLTAESAGKYTPPSEVTISLLHDFAKLSMWHLPRTGALQVEADGEKVVEFKCTSDFNVNKTSEKCLQNEATKDEPTDATYYDAAHFTIPSAAFEKMASAGGVRVKIGGATFTLTDAAKSSLKAFSEVTHGHPSTTGASAAPVSTAPSNRITSPPPPSSYGVTFAGYNQLRTGMTYKEVVKILGKEGVEISRNDLAGYTTVMYQWEGEGSLGANMNAMFQNGRLIQKAQFGLR
jgi:hypothetical protein